MNRPGANLSEFFNGILNVRFASSERRGFRDVEVQALGKVANLRAKHFEAAVQEVVDRSSWRPSAAFRQYVGRHLRQNGRELTDIDAIAERNGVVLLISCKSVLPNEAFERGDYRELRNAVTTIVDGTKKYRALADVIRTAPRGDNFDFSAAQSIHFVLVTPSTIHVPQAVGERIALNGLREYSTVEELRQWLDDDPDQNDRGSTKSDARQ